ncbi:TonB-dependent receptor [Parapedobacter sp. ISTM3]|uniref:SusC/RagA family TonB-linked outer membrane protein n=1 Tax=Parapedobacter sp. ISTM3 TaxID=2800130 RepID=UPI001903266F|nr:TonB-dependent receptor [Parapedobacter sp. ISTM3]MBK1442024.1 TonB-dependent receptor [Parapedobacter sp. ISTM3]
MVNIRQFLRLLLLCFPVVVPVHSARAQGNVTGKVVDAEGIPIEGATVLVKGTTVSAGTDAEGQFSIAAQPDDWLVISSVGYKIQEVQAIAGTPITITLESDEQILDQVVVVGYGTQRKANVTGSIATLTVDEKMTSRSLSNVSSGLAGMLPGLAANQSRGMAGNNNANLMIRGLGTVNNSSPLIVVDGMPDVDINRLNMNDIESISVLKDATSSSVYGSRAANGVILITTKSGRGKEASITFNSTVAMQRPTKSFSFMADYPRALTLHQLSQRVNTLDANLLFKNGTIDQWMALGMIDPLRYPNTDWWDIILRDGAIQNYNLSATGGNDRSSFFFSGGMMDEKGLQINNDYTRYNARLNYDYKIRDNINIGARIQGNWSKYTYALDEGFTDDNASNTAGFDLQYAIAGITPYDPVSGYYGGVMAYNEDPQAYNPYTVYQNMLNRNNRQETNANVFLEWEFFEGLKAKVDGSLNYYNQFSWSANMPNTAYNFQGNRFGSRVYVGNNAGVSNATATGYKTLLNAQLNYNKTIAQNHRIGALFVFSEEFWYDRVQSGSRNDRLHPSLHEIDAALTDIQTAGGNSNNEGLRSFIGRLNYQAFDRYLFEFNFRYDGSSKFLEGSRFGFFPSAAIGWRFTEEGFLSALKNGVLNSGKLRASYGGLGNNSGVGRYEQQPTLASSPYIIGNQISRGFVNRKMVNPLLSWEKTTVLNLGLDLGWFNNRLTSELDYYDRLTTGMNRPSEMSIHLTGAYDAPRQNIGDLRNRGVEANITWAETRGGFNYSINLNGSYNTTVLEKWNEFLGRGTTFIGMPYHFVYTFEDIGIAQTWQDIYSNTPQGASPGDILRRDVNGDGRIDANDRVAYPHSQLDMPTTNFAMNSAVAWRGIDLAILLQGAAGRKNYWINNYNNVNFGNSRYASTWDHWYLPWSVENRNGEWPRLAGNANREETTFWLDDMSYLRLKNIQVGYSLPNNLLSRLRIRSFRVYLSAENLLTFTSYRGVDPESTATRNDMYPLTKSYTVGLNLSL